MNAEMFTGRGGAKILVGDDEPGSREMLEAILSAEGWRVAKAASGREALEWCNRERFDIVVLDQNMPVMTGLEVAAELRAGAHSPATILFSAHLDSALRARCEDVGAIPIDKINWPELVVCCHVLTAELAAEWPGGRLAMLEALVLH